MEEQKQPQDAIEGDKAGKEKPNKGIDEDNAQERKAEKPIKGTRINKIVLNGFKSFAKHTEILFNSSYNCVLGPNGSGKSNVLDAICFVLGKSSSKSLRADKSANLIYNGGKLKKPAKNGEVSIFFDNSQKIFPTEDKEVKISRIVRQNGQSVYKINDETRTRQEILDLLSIARINPDAYNIILQGDIIRFVEMHPNERRELIGEIAGISVYEERKKKAINELNRVDEKLKETDIVLAERNTYLKELKKDRDQALKYKNMSDRIRINKASYLKLQIDKKEQVRDDMQKSLDKTKLELEKINEKINSIKTDNKEKREKIEEITREIEEKGEIEEIKLNKEVENLKIDITKKNYRNDVIDTELTRIKQRKIDLINGIKETKEKIQDLEKEKKAMQDDIAKNKKEKFLIDKKIKEFKEKNNLDNVGEIEKRVEEIDKKSDELQKDVQETREQQHGLIREKDRIMHDINSIEAQIDKVLEVEKEHKKQLEELKNKRDEFKKSTLDLNIKLDEDSVLAAKLGAVRKEATAKDEELSKLNVRQIATRELSFSDIAIKRIIELKKPGVYGTVAELGNVDSKYSMALEIAAGQKIKSIAVEDDKTASECIKYLKDKKLGIATFLPMNKIRSESSKPEVRILAKSNGSYGLAIDLVSFEPKFKKIFNFVFSDTIVVENIDVARRLGLGKAKYIALDGDLAEKSAAMRGGYRLKRKHGMGFKEKDIAEDIEKLESEIFGLRDRIDVMEKRRIENEEEIARLRILKANLEGETIKMEKSLHLDTKDLDASREKKDSLEKYEKEVEKKINLVQEKVNILNKELANVKIEKQKLRSSINQLRNPTLIAELNAFEEKNKELNEAIINIDSDIKVIDTKSENIYKKELENSYKIIKQLGKDEEDFNIELNKLSEELKQKDNELKEKEALARDFKSKFKGLFHKRSDIDKEIQNNDNRIGSKQEESRKIEIRLNTFSLKLAEFNATLAGFNQEFQQYEGVKLDAEKNEEQLKNEIGKFEKMREEIGSVNMRALEVYDEVEKQYNVLIGKKNILDNEKMDVMKMMDEIEGKKIDLFMNVFEVVNSNFQNFFSKITTKGAQANLVIENEENPFEEGVRINVKITGSKFLDIRSLSGGEKTLTALAFIFAIQEHEPASFYVLDEVDAALDKHNSEKFAKLIKQYSEKAQYVIISHNDAVISEASTLYGVSMNEHGISQVVSLKI